MESTHMTLAGDLADRSQWTAENCSIDATMRALGNRSTMLIMREAHYGTTRYDDFVHRVGITEAVAAARLRELVSAGLLERRPYREPGQRTRHEYVLTPAGLDLQPVLVALMQWGDRHLAQPSGPPLTLHHTDCDEPVTARLMCAAGHEVEAEEVTVRAARRR
ncbi:winged helix-turn-helix transcriptional regulator [Streptomyces tauricus]|uniref:winged helix-turn-helix transcriptional regulator n=1 Tax=Streptomyces tauricus TaxID=68274 RepID=UPI002244D13B|nr:helix-turn-helix domain-containing protein [Streptomyces tauricus]MCW8102566.1 helix-turn-helix transcriptional regulator [Streptomyces tauricus]